jgi:hypothetical protein
MPSSHETGRIEASSMPSLPVVTHDQTAACERGQHWIESLSVQHLRTHMDRTEGREILAAGGVIRYALDLPGLRRPHSAQRN